MALSRYCVGEKNDFVTEKFLDLNSMPQISFEESLYIPLTTFPLWTSFIKNKSLIHFLLKYQTHLSLEFVSDPLIEVSDPQIEVYPGQYGNTKKLFWGGEEGGRKEGGNQSFSKLAVEQSWVLNDR